MSHYDLNIQGSTADCLEALLEVTSTCQHQLGQRCLAASQSTVPVDDELLDGLGHRDILAKERKGL